MKNMHNCTIVVDCSALCYASAFTLVGLTDKEAEVGVIYGFLLQIRSLAQRFCTNDIVFCWDSKSSKRKTIFPEYKNKRKKKRKEDPAIAAAFAATYTQIGKLKNHILPAMGAANSFEQNGLEADDLIADIVMGYPDCVIVSNDEDLFQLLTYANMWLAGSKKLLTKDSFIQDYNISPKEWAMVKAIGGCKTDEVPGIPGVGEKTAIKYLNGDLPKTYKTFKAIESGWEDVVERNIPLVKLPFKETEQIHLTDYEWDIIGFWDICCEYRFDSFMKGNDRKRWEIFLKGEL